MVIVHARIPQYYVYMHLGNCGYLHNYALPYIIILHQFVKLIYPMHALTGSSHVRAHVHNYIIRSSYSPGTRTVARI